MTKNTENAELAEVSHQVAKQYIDAQKVFEALVDARKDQAQLRGSMHWKAVKGREYLIKVSAAGAQHSLGPRSNETSAIYAKFLERKTASRERVAALKQALDLNKKLNKAYRVGRLDPLVIDILNALDDSGLGTYFRVVGTHALYAYEARAGLVYCDDALSTRDVDLLWDVRRRIQFSFDLEREGGSLLGVLHKVDKSFKIRDLQKYTAVNSKGFEVDVLRRQLGESDPHPIKLGKGEDEFYAVQARRANQLMDAPLFEAMVVASNGTMAKMRTPDPGHFARFKRWMAQLPDRDPAKRRRDLLQAMLVERTVSEHLLDSHA